MVASIDVADCVAERPQYQEPGAQAFKHAIGPILAEAWGMFECCSFRPPGRDAVVEKQNAPFLLLPWPGDHFRFGLNSRTRPSLYSKPASKQCRIEQTIEPIKPGLILGSAIENLPRLTACLAKNKNWSFVIGCALRDPCEYRCSRLSSTSIKFRRRLSTVNTSCRCDFLLSFGQDSIHLVARFHNLSKSIVNFPSISLSVERSEVTRVTTSSLSQLALRNHVLAAQSHRCRQVAIVLQTPSSAIKFTVREEWMKFRMIDDQCFHR